MALQAGMELPPGVAITRDGQPTSDPTEALDGAQLPFGHHKGNAISIMVELLAAGLVGGDFSFDTREVCPDESSSTPTCSSELVIALDPAQVGGLTQSALLAHCERLYDRILATEGTQLPSTGRHCGTDRLTVRAQSDASGAAVPSNLVAEIEALIADPNLITNPYFKGGVHPETVL